MQGPELLLPASAAACLLQQPQQSRRHTWHLRGACTLAPALAWTSRQSSGQDQQDASCSGAGQGATSAGAASSTAADRRCQAPALSPPSASALCSAKTCGAHAGSAHAVLRGLRGLRTRARHAAAELGARTRGLRMWSRVREANPEPARSGGAGRRAGPPATARRSWQACRARAADSRRLQRARTVKAFSNRRATPSRFAARSRSWKPGHSGEAGRAGGAGRASGVRASSGGPAAPAPW